MGSVITLRQKQLLDYIKGYQVEHKVTPTYKEMADHMGLSSKSGVHRAIVAMEERGYIRRMAGRARALEVVENRRMRLDEAVATVLSQLDLSPNCVHEIRSAMRASA